MTNPKVSEADKQMERIVEHSKEDFAGIRSGRANPALLNRVMVDYYGQSTPLQQLGLINALDAKTLVISVYDKNAVHAVEKGLTEANLGLNPASEGNIVRVSLPSLTEERRKDYIKLAKSKGEDVKIQLRNVRQKVRQELDKEVKAKQLGEDEKKGIEKHLDEVISKWTKEVDTIVANKEAELKEI